MKQMLSVGFKLIADNEFEAGLLEAYVRVLTSELCESANTPGAIIYMICETYTELMELEFGDRFESWSAMLYSPFIILISNNTNKVIFTKVSTMITDACSTEHGCDVKTVVSNMYDHAKNLPNSHAQFRLKQLAEQLAEHHGLARH